MAVVQSSSSKDLASVTEPFDEAAAARKASEPVTTTKNGRASDIKPRSEQIDLPISQKTGVLISADHKVFNIEHESRQS